MKLLFVYNADAGLPNLVADIARKLFAPRSYPCQLCKITHGYFRARSEWLVFVRSLAVEAEFLHRDEPRTRYGLEIPLPAVVREQEGRVRVCLERAVTAPATSTRILFFDIAIPRVSRRLRTPTPCPPSAYRRPVRPSNCADTPR